MQALKESMQELETVKTTHMQLCQQYEPLKVRLTATRKVFDDVLRR